MIFIMHILTQIFLTHLLFSYLVSGGPEEQQGIKYANKCEGNYIHTVRIDNFLEVYGKNDTSLFCHSLQSCCHRIRS